MTPVASLLAMVTGQKGTAVISKSGTGIVVVVVETPPSTLTRREVVRGGQVTIVGVGNGSSGKMNVQGAWHESSGESLSQMSGETYSSPLPPAGNRSVAFEILSVKG
jgi:hypothetical protein